jgi:hypothetical protein
MKELVSDPGFARPAECRAGAIRDGHWIGFLFLLPFMVMFVVHHLLGMTGALLMAATPWDRVSADFNLALAIVGFLGSAGFVVSAVALPIVQGQGWRWIVPKFAFLVIYWLMILLVASWLSLLGP